MRKLIKQHDILCVTPAMKRYICSHMKKTKQIYETAMKEGCSVSTIAKRECYLLDALEKRNMEYCRLNRMQHYRITIYDQRLMWHDLCLSRYLKRGMRHDNTKFAFAYMYEQSYHLHVVIFYRNT